MPLDTGKEPTDSRASAPAAAAAPACPLLSADGSGDLGNLAGQLVAANQRPKELEEIQSGIGVLKEKVASLEGSQKLITIAFTAISIILALVSVISVGLKYLEFKDVDRKIEESDQRNQKVDSTIKDVTGQVNSLTGSQAKVLAGILVETVDSIFDEYPSIESLKNSDAVTRLRSLDEQLKALNKYLPPDEQVTYSIVIDAALMRDFPRALQLLDGVSSADQKRFYFLYLRGILNSRNRQRLRAVDDFQGARAIAATSRRRLKVMNAEGFVHLDAWTNSNPKPVDELREATTIYTRIVQEYPDFAPGYTNLASCICQGGSQEYGHTTDTLLVPIRRGIRTVEELAKVLVDDLNDPTQGEFRHYVEDYLGVRPPYSDPDSWTKVASALREKLRRDGGNG